MIISPLEYTLVAMVVGILVSIFVARLERDAFLGTVCGAIIGMTWVIALPVGIVVLVFYLPARAAVKWKATKKGR